MTELHRLSPEERSELVAYLDGELGDAETERIEAAMSTNPIVRHEIEMLTRTWEMLDTLPRSTVSEEFTARTLSAIAIQEQDPTYADKPWAVYSRKAFVLAVWLALLAGSAVLGFNITYRWIPHEADPLVNDFRVINNLDTYEEVRNVDYLRSLQSSGAFNEPAQANP